MKLDEIVDKFTGSKFSDGQGTYSVEAAIRLAKKIGTSEPHFPISKLEHDLEWWYKDASQSKEHMKTVDTTYPLLVTVDDEGNLSVADGLNRLMKAKTIEHKTTVPVYLLPWNEQTKHQVAV